MLYNNWKTDMDRTAPCLEILRNKVFKGAIFKSIEKSDNEILLWLDTLAGIDYVIKKKNGQIFGVASRIQFGKNWRTFTIRFKRVSGNKTEFEKRKEAMAKGYFYPTYTLQAYFNKDGTELNGACMVRTEDLYNFIDQNPNKILKRKSDNEFLVIKWDDLKNMFLYEI